MKYTSFLAFTSSSFVNLIQHALSHSVTKPNFNKMLTNSNKIKSRLPVVNSPSISKVDSLGFYNKHEQELKKSNSGNNMKDSTKYTGKSPNNYESDYQYSTDSSSGISIKSVTDNESEIDSDTSLSDTSYQKHKKHKESYNKSNAVTKNKKTYSPRRSERNSGKKNISHNERASSTHSLSEYKFNSKTITSPEYRQKSLEQKAMIQKFEDNSRAVKKIYDSSSDSEDALEPFKETRKYSQIKRRQEHKKDLIAIAKQAFPPDDETRQLYSDAIKSRDKNRQYQNEQGYSKDTIRAYKDIGKHIKEITVMHNPLLRKAFTQAIPKTQALKSSIQEYNENQGNIRTELLGVIQQDALKMHWKENEFEDPKIWKVINFLQDEVMSGDSNKVKISDAINYKKSLKGCSPFVAWHHIAYKASEDVGGNMYVSVYSLRPDGLMAAHDTRDQKDGTVAQTQWGEHELIHRATSTSITSRFNNMDETAINILLEKTLVPKTTKRQKYALNIIERLDNYAKNIDPSNEDAIDLNQTISKLTTMAHVKDVDKFLSNKLANYPWGQELLKQQEKIDQRTLSAAKEVSGEDRTRSRS